MEPLRLIVTSIDGAVLATKMLGAGSNPVKLGEKVMVYPSMPGARE